MVASAVDRVLADIVEKQGWIPGTKLENQVAFILSKYKAPPAVQQHRVGRRLRLDFAWPQVGIALEADGWHHRSPGGASKDRQRDSWLRSQGWVIFRVDDEHGEATLNHQVFRVVRMVRAELDSPLGRWADVERHTWPWLPDADARALPDHAGHHGRLPHPAAHRPPVGRSRPLAAHRRQSPPLPRRRRPGVLRAPRARPPHPRATRPGKAFRSAA